MKRLAEDLYILRGFPPHAINVYLIEDVIVDSGTRFARNRVLGQVRGRPVAAHALTHAHPDHQGASHAICETLGIPLWCGLGDVRAVEAPGGIRAAPPHSALARLADSVFGGPPHPVARALREGDSVAGFTVLETPGHSIGHISFWRESDRALVAGDVLLGANGGGGLREPPAALSADPARNRDSIRRLAALEPALVCLGHGAPWRDAAALSKIAARLPQ